MDSELKVISPAGDEPAGAVALAGHRATTSTTGDMLHALKRAIERLEADADRLAAQGNYDAEFPASDAEALRDVVTLLGGDRASRVQFARTPDPMEAPLPCMVRVGHLGFQKGVALRSLVDHMKSMYRLAYGSDADAVANESLESRKARGDATLARMRSRRLGIEVEGSGRARTFLARLAASCGLTRRRDEDSFPF